MTIYWVASNDPLHDDEDFNTYREACDRVRELAEGWQEEGFKADFGIGY